MQVNIGAAVGRPAKFDSFVPPHLDSLHIAGNPPIFDAQIKAAWLGGGGLCQTIAATANE